MNLFFKKLNTFLCLSAFSAGIIFCSGSFSGVPQNVKIDGVEVGGMSRPAAVSLLRENVQSRLKNAKLIVSGGKTYTFSYPEISYKDNFKTLVGEAKKNGVYSSEIAYYLCGLDEIAPAICRNESLLPVEPHAIFNADGEPFTYFAGNDGKTANLPSLKRDILSSLRLGIGKDGNFTPVNVVCGVKKRKTTLSEVRESTRPLGEFTTYFDASNLNRASNIRLAAALINGAVIEGGKTFSFNDIVGARTPERGFLPAKIIENGEYVEGVGGGVCQVSTTVYNAALVSGMTVTEFHPHTLQVSYVPPSRDAMVSGSFFDLKFKNPATTPVYIRAKTGEGSVTVSFYGKSDGAAYSLESVITGTVPAGEDIAPDPSLVREGRDGVLSEGYLLIGRGGYIKRVKLRSDSYGAVKKLLPPPEN